MKNSIFLMLFLIVHSAVGQEDETDNFPPSRKSGGD